MLMLGESALDVEAVLLPRAPLQRYGFPMHKE